MDFPHLCLSGCRSSSSGPAPSDPETAIRNIRAEIVHGNLAVAQNRAEEELKRYSGHDPRRATEFRLLDAEILGLEGRSRDSLLLLTDTSATYPVTGDLAIKRKMLCSLAHVHLGQPQLADRELQGSPGAFRVRSLFSPRRGCSGRRHPRSTPTAVCEGHRLVSSQPSDCPTTEG